MRAVLFAVLVAGCASGGHAFGTDDGSVGGGSDAKEFLDGQIEVADGMIDARPIDAAIDAPPDAPPDARPIDAAIDAPPDACIPQQTELLANPAFDLEPMGTLWQQLPIQNVVCNGSPCGPFPLITGDVPSLVQSAPYLVFLGGITGSDVSPAQSHVTDQMFQDFTVPPGTTQLVLTGFYQVGTTDDPSFPFDTADVALIQTNGSPIEDVLALSNQTSTTDWVPLTHTFTTNLSGQTVRLRLTSTNDDSFNTNFFFDTFSIVATHCP